MPEGVVGGYAVAGVLAGEIFHLREPFLPKMLIAAVFTSVSSAIVF